MTIKTHDNVEVRDARFSDIVGDGIEFEQLGTGYAFTEGAVWHPTRKTLIFSDMPGDCMRMWSMDEGVRTFRSPCNMANGNAYDRQGRLVSCEHATSRLVRTESNGDQTVLASHYDGKELNSPNDVVVKSDGSIYFSDPIYGRIEYYGVAREPQLDFRGVYRVSGDGKLTLLTDDFGQPNGLCFSLDEKVLFVNDTERMHIRAFDVNADGTLGANQVWAELTGDGPGAPDGLKIDSQGNVFCCGPAGIHVFAPDATCLGVIRTPEVAGNFTWGDDDLRSFFIAASTSLYRIRLQVPGRTAF